MRLPAAFAVEADLQKVFTRRPKRDVAGGLPGCRQTVEVRRCNDEPRDNAQAAAMVDWLSWWTIGIGAPTERDKERKWQPGVF